MPIRTNIYTGELEEFPASETGIEIIARGRLPFGEQTVTRRRNAAWSRPLRSSAIAVNPKQAASFSEAAKAAGTGAYYDPKTGEAVFESRRARNEECKRRGVYDHDAGYSDYAGGCSELPTGE